MIKVLNSFQGLSKVSCLFRRIHFSRISRFFNVFQGFSKQFVPFQCFGDFDEGELANSGEEESSLELGPEK